MKKHFVPIALVVMTFALWGCFYNQLPAKIPIHWNISGHVDGYATKLNGMLMNVGLMTGVYLLQLVKPKIDSSRHYKRITTTVMFFLFLMNLIIILIGLGYNLSINRILPLLIGALFIILGNYMQSIKPNYFIGFKTRWTLNNDMVWKKTHRFGSRMFMIAGGLFIISILFPDSLIGYLIPIILIVVLSPVLYSYLLYRKIVQS